jgi:hypothetical protein
LENAGLARRRLQPSREFFGQTHVMQTHVIVWETERAAPMEEFSEPPVGRGFRRER